ncbi:MAG TPA: energy transducer TonB [Candidatus Acidoferrales bacterium]|nr:energy transducer TonB [Candidatus Acidoferrales bacterium]
MDNVKQYMVTEITAPPVRAWKPQPKVRPKLEPVKRVEVAKAEPVPVPEPPKPKMIEPVFEKPVVSKPVIRRNPTTAPQVNVFARAVPDKPTTSLGSSAMPDLKQPKAPVQTGGFGDPDGLPSKAKVTQPVNVARAGGFDMPVGPGKGNGTGGAKGVQGVVASAGFGNGTAIAGGVRNGGKVQQGVFANDRPTNESHARKPSNAAPAQEGPVILFKPKPEYTAEGKQLRIQGEVLLEVIFKASGEVQVVRVVQGLGHGLDQNAEAAARKIRFKPAHQDGQPVDFPANVRIDFELAY